MSTFFFVVYRMSNINGESLRIIITYSCTIGINDVLEYLVRSDTQLCCAFITICSNVPGQQISRIMLYSWPFFLMSPMRIASLPPCSSAEYCFKQQ